MRVKRKTTEPTRKQNYSTDNASSSFSTCRHCGGLSRRAHGVSVIVSGIEVSNSPCVASIHGDDRIVHTHPNTRTQTHAPKHTHSHTRTHTLQALALGPCGPRHPFGASPRHTLQKTSSTPFQGLSPPSTPLGGWVWGVGWVACVCVGGVRGEGRRGPEGVLLFECFCLNALCLNSFVFECVVSECVVSGWCLGA